MKTEEQAKRDQEELAKKFDLGFWYGTKCEKCCGVYPAFRHSDLNGGGCWYECEVCGKRTEEVAMPWIAEEAWNAGQFREEQMRWW